MTLRTILLLVCTALAVLALAWWAWSRQQSHPNAEAAAAASMSSMPAPEGPLRVYHLGHSLVGRDMPAMLVQLAGAGHAYDSQLGWGTSLKEHWEPGFAINGFEAENDHPRFRPAEEAIGSGDYDAVILTEMVELRDAIKYHDSAAYLSRWAGLAGGAKDGVRLYLYETWHNLDDPDGWLDRLDTDLAELWEAKVLLPAIAASGQTIHVIPAGQVMAEFVRRIENGDAEGLARREDLFARTESGQLDTIHINDIGAYLVALTHYAVLYHRSPVGLPHRLLKADGTPAVAPSREAAQLMQDTVWRIVTSYPRTGVAK